MSFLALVRIPGEKDNLFQILRVPLPIMSKFENLSNENSVVLYNTPVSDRHKNPARLEVPLQTNVQGHRL